MFTHYSPPKVLNEGIVRNQLNTLRCFPTKHPQPCVHFPVHSVEQERLQSWRKVDLRRKRLLSGGSKNCIYIYIHQNIYLQNIFVFGTKRNAIDATGFSIT